MCLTLPNIVRFSKFKCLWKAWEKLQKPRALARGYTTLLLGSATPEKYCLLYWPNSYFRSFYFWKERGWVYCRAGTFSSSLILAMRCMRWYWNFTMKELIDCADVEFDGLPPPRFNLFTSYFNISILNFPSWSLLAASSAWKTRKFIIISQQRFYVIITCAVGFLIF